MSTLYEHDMGSRGLSKQQGLMLHAYRLIYPESPHARPALWEWQQPYIDHLISNARRFKTTTVSQPYFRDWDELDRANTCIWQAYYRPSPLYVDTNTWREWLGQYRQIILDVQDIYEENCW